MRTTSPLATAWRAAWTVRLLLFLILASCGAPTPTLIMPTQAVLPTLTPTPIPPTHTPAAIAVVVTETEAPSAEPPSATTPPLITATAAAVVSPTPSAPLASDLLTQAIAQTLTAQPTVTPSLTPLVYQSPTPTTTPTPTITPTITLTPSETITPTITPTPSNTPTLTPDVGILGLLAIVAQDATILPLEMRVPPPTLTARALTAAAPPPLLPSITPAPPSISCLYPPPSSLSLMLNSDPALLPALGCPLGTPPIPTPISGAWQFFERGAMVYVGAPIPGLIGQIYVMINDGRFRRFDDTFVQGVDPEVGSESAPLNLVTPARGFGKVWRNNPDVRAALGWATVPEVGGALTEQRFERGRAVALVARGETAIFVEDGGTFGTLGAWRVLPGTF